MEASTVYYTDFRCPVGTSLTDKLRRLCIAAGIKNIDMEGKFVAIKMHFGELGNLAYLRPNYAKVVADLCKEQGGMPFLTDCNTLYPGSRKNALEHLTCAQLNGFWPMTTGCQVLIADGLRGTDEVEVPVPNGEYCKTAKIGRAIMDADIFISLSHFKGHESTGFGGAIKNIGMGCGSRAGKMEQHASGHPAVQEDLCRGCHRCAKECGSDAIRYNEKNKAVIDQDKCKGCGRCIGACNFDAIYSQYDSANEMLDRKMSEYAAAVCAGRPCFHISLVQDVSPNCDCHGENDAPILPDIGIVASFDPVALEHLSCAQLNGFWPMTTGCQVIIGDGLRGTDEVEVPVPNGEYCKTAKIGRAIMDADVFISLTHFKGHESTGFGGALKNIGMGCGSRAGKMEQHAAGKPAVQEGLCRGCHRCAKECGSDAITYNAENKAVIDYDKCKGCGRCIGACSFDAIYSPNDCANELLDRKMAEYAAAVCHDRPCFHISLVQDISPNCDCHGENDAPILPDIGIFASFDPVALDQACVDACLNAAPLPNSQLSTNLAKPGWNCYHDNFKDSNPNIEWKATLEQAEKVGMGTRQYVLKKV